MSEASRREVRAGLEACLARLWRYAVVLSRTRDAADDLVQATCLRAIERADQFVPGTRLDRWLFSSDRSVAGGAAGNGVAGLRRGFQLR